MKARLHMANGIIVEGPVDKVADLVGRAPSSLKRRASYYKGKRMSSMTPIELRNAIVEMVYKDLLNMGMRRTVRHFLEGSEILNDPVFDALVMELHAREEETPGLRFYTAWRGY